MSKKIRVTTELLVPNPYRMIAATNQQFTEGVVKSDLITPDADFKFGRGWLNGLEDDTEYYLAIESVTGRIDSYIGKFRTSGSESFSFGFASCNTTNSNALTFQSIQNKSESGDIDFFIHLGDIHYRDIIVNDEALFQNAFSSHFNFSRPNACWKVTPMLYIWDDHDYGPNDSDRDSPSRQAAVAAYRSRVPSPELAASGAEDAPYYSYIRGRIRFIMTDVRSERAVKGEFPTSDPNQVVFAETQKQWFFSEMLAAKSAGQVICWANAKPWISEPSTGADDWGGYDAARQEIADFVAANDLAKRMFIISGDMHACAYDDGSSANNAGSITVIQSAALHQNASNKGGPYLIGPIPSPPSGQVYQYSILDVSDNGGSIIEFNVSAIAVNPTTGAESGLYSTVFTKIAEAE